MNRDEVIKRLKDFVLYRKDNEACLHEAHTLLQLDYVIAEIEKNIKVEKETGKKCK